MINLFFEYGFGTVTLFIAVNWTLFFGVMRLKGDFAKPFKEITNDWRAFMTRGIPVPADYRRFEGPFAGKPTLAQPVFDPNRTDPVAR